MSPRRRTWLYIALLAVVCGGAVWGVARYRARPISPGMLLKRIPYPDAVVVYIDFAELRKAGILQLLEGAKTTEDPDYQSFVRKINFDYRQDLDAAMVGFASNGKYMLVRGRFDWKSLRSYALSSGGVCVPAMCKMAGSSPERRISFFPIQTGLMALAVSTEEAAAVHISETPPGPPETVPDAPVWISVPGALLKSGENLPTGTKMFAHGMEKAEKVTLSFVPEGNRLAAKLEVRCQNPQDAIEVSSQLASATLTLKQMLEREHQTPGPADLAGVLAGGSFRSEGQVVYGYWPMERIFVQTMLGSS